MFRNIIKVIFLVSLVLSLQIVMKAQGSNQKNPIVTLDPGHGTKYSVGGAKGEKEFAMDVAKLLKVELEQAGVKVILTHEKTDGSEKLGKNQIEDNIYRANLANKNNSLLYFRIHADSPEGTSAIYYPQKHPVNLVAQRSRNASGVIWESILPVVKSAGVKVKEGILTDASTGVGSKQGGLLTGSKAAKVPVVLVEMLPLNAKGISWIEKAANQQELADAMAKGILTYIKLGKGN